MSENTDKPAATPPSAARVSRIEKILVAEPAIKPKLGKKEVALKCRDGTTTRHAQSVIDITQAFIDAGKEPFTVVKKEVLDMARRVLKLDCDGSQPAEVAPATEPPAAAVIAAAQAEPDEPSPAVEGEVAAAGDAAAPEASAANVKPKKQVPDQTISIVALLLSATNISEIGDSHVGNEERRRKLVELKDMYVAAANIRVG